MLRAYREQTIQYVMPHAEGASTLETPFSWEKDHEATFIFKRHRHVLFIYAVVLFVNIAFHH